MKRRSPRGSLIPEALRGVKERRPDGVITDREGGKEKRRSARQYEDRDADRCTISKVL
jgi:hypothetical protein